MACYHPVPYHQDVSWRQNEKGPEKIRGPVRINPNINAETGYLPCGTCLGCKARRANDWALRCMHEASLYPHNRFLTLTYDEQHIPANNWLNIRDVQLWMKRLRKSLPTRIRYFLTGEYGSQTGRPHYHALLFNCQFPDEKKAGNLYTAATADELWGMGQVRIGLVTHASAAYCTKYALKSGTGHPSAEGEPAPKPFSTMSRGGRGKGLGGIGSPWLTKYESDLQHGYLIRDGEKTPIPRAYKKKLAPQTQDNIDYARSQEDTRPAESRARLQAAEQIHRAKLALYNRDSL